MLILRPKSETKGTQNLNTQSTQNLNTQYTEAKTPSTQNLNTQTHKLIPFKIIYKTQIAENLQLIAENCRNLQLILSSSAFPYTSHTTPTHLPTDRKSVV